MTRTWCICPLPSSVSKRLTPLITTVACASSQSSHAFGLGDGLINRAHEVEGFLRHMVILPRHNGLAAPDGLGQCYMLTYGACPWFRAIEGLREEALHTARPGNIVRQVEVLLNIPKGVRPSSFILLVQISIAPQQAPHL